MAEGGCISGCGIIATILLILFIVFIAKIIGFLIFVWITANLPT